MHAVTTMGNYRIYLKSFVLDIHSSGASTSSVVAFGEEGAITIKKYSFRVLFLDVTTKVTQKMAKLCIEYPFLTIVARSE